MKQVSITQYILRVLYTSVFLVACLAVFSGTTEAALTEPYGIESTSVPTHVCVAPIIQNFTSYIYDGELNSFEYTVSGSKNVLVVATFVGERGIEYRYSTQRQNNDSTRVHVDVPSWYGFSGEVRIIVSVATGADSHCWGVGEFRVKLAGPTKTAKPIAPTSGVTMPSAEESFADTPLPPKDVSVLDNSTPNAVNPENAKQEDAALSESSDASLTRSMIASLGAFLGADIPKKQCRDLPQSAWIALIIACIVALLIIVDRLPYLLKGNGVKFAVALLVMFVVALAAWFVFDQCRLHRWFPIAVTVLTLVTLIAPTALDTKKLRTRR